MNVQLALWIVAAGTLPNWGWHDYGYTPVGTIVFLLVLVLLLRGRL